MKFFKLLLGTWLLGLLVACGGGGGSPGGNPNQPALITAAGSEVTLLPGASNSYGVSGGVPPYRVQNADPATAVGVVVGEVLTVTGLRAGTANVAVLDNFGVANSITVKVGSSLPLVTTAPDTLFLGIGAEFERAFSISGGVEPYEVSSSNSGLVSAVKNGTSFTLRGLQPGTVSVTVRDAANVIKTISVTAGSVVPLFTTAPAAVSLEPGSDAKRDFSIGGGTEPYTVTSANAGVATAELTGKNGISVVGKSPGSTVVTVRDAANAAVNITVTVAPLVALYTGAPPTVTVAVGAMASFTVAGGVSPYTAASSNAGVATVTLNGTSSITITGEADGGGDPAVAGEATVLVTDAVGSRVSIAVTVPIDSSPASTVAP